MIPSTRARLMKLLLVVGGSYAGLLVLLFLMQRSLIYFPPRGSAAVETERLRVADATLVIAVRRANGPGALLYFGGNAEDVAWSLPQLAQTFPERSLYLPYYRGYGESTGKPSEAALHADALALFDRVYPEHPDVLVMGRSLGSGVAARLATLRPVTRLLLVTPFDSLLRVAQRHYRIFPIGWLLRDTYETWRWAPQIDAPTLLLAAEHDAIVSLAQTRTLLSRFRPGIATLRIVPGADHDSISASPEYPTLLRQGS
jgi:pimeloyl-ACP methyl ester carboxylesterase